jgi:hypothetical protein
MLRSNSRVEEEEEERGDRNWVMEESLPPIPQLHLD